MKPAPIPIFDGTTPITPIDPAGARIYEGFRGGAYAVARHELEEQVRQLDKTLPPKTARRRERAALTAAERRFISPHNASGARNSADDLALIQKAHDAMHDLGATCTQTTGNSEMFQQDGANA